MFRWIAVRMSGRFAGTRPERSSHGQECAPSSHRIQRPPQLQRQLVVGWRVRIQDRRILPRLPAPHPVMVVAHRLGLLVSGVLLGAGEQDLTFFLTPALPTLLVVFGHELLESCGTTLRVVFTSPSLVTLPRERLVADFTRAIGHATRPTLAFESPAGSMDSRRGRSDSFCQSVVSNDPGCVHDQPELAIGQGLALHGVIILHRGHRERDVKLREITDVRASPRRAY